MQPNKHASLTLLLALSCGLGACTSQPHPTGSPTVPATSSATPSASAKPSPTPTPTPTHSPIGPEGTVLIQDGKAWLESKDGTYTIDIPQGFEPHEPTERSNGNPFLQSTSDKQAVIAFTPRLDLRSVPSRQQIKDALSNTLTNEPQIRDDLTVFAGQPAITTQFKVIPWGENDHAGYDGTILSLFTEIGGTRWGLSFTGSNPSEAENLMQQAADSLTKQ